MSTIDHGDGTGERPRRSDDGAPAAATTRREARDRDEKERAGSGRDGRQPASPERTEAQPRVDDGADERTGALGPPRRTGQDRTEQPRTVRSSTELPGVEEPHDDARREGAQRAAREDTPPVRRASPDEHAYQPAQASTARADVVAREKERFGGVKIGSAFFGWLAATGMAVVLVAVLGAVGLLVGAATTADAGDAVGAAATDPVGAGLVGAVALLVVLLVAYFCGGYVAGRMARFDGLKQGVAVWVWAVVIAILVGVVGLVAGNRSGLLQQVTLPQTSASGGDVTLTSVLFVVALAVVTLVGAILGGLAGMRFHRRVDRAGLGG